jgi:hypothetical protein
MLAMKTNGLCQTFYANWTIITILWVAGICFTIGLSHAAQSVPDNRTAMMTEKLHRLDKCSDKMIEDDAGTSPSELAEDMTNTSGNAENDVFEIPMFMDEDPDFTWKEFNPSEENPIFKHGETLVYDVSWMGINAGTIRIELIVDAQHDGKPVYKGVVTGETNRAFSLFFKVRDVITSFIDPETFNSVFYTKNIREGRHRKYLETTYDQDKRQAIIDDKRFDIPPNTKDPVACFYALRRYRPQENVAIRMNSNSDGKHNYPIKIGLETIETVKLVDRMERPAIRALPLPTWEGRVFEKRDSEVIIWLSDDVHAVPLKLETKVRIGTLKGELISRTGPGWELNPERKR